MASDVILFYFLVPLVQKSESQIREGFRQNRPQDLLSFFLSLFCFFAPSFQFSSFLSLFLSNGLSLRSTGVVVVIIIIIIDIIVRHELGLNGPGINKKRRLSFQVLSPSGIRILTSLLQDTGPLILPNHLDKSSSFPILCL